MKIYRSNKYEGKHLKQKKRRKGKVLVILGVGVIVISVIAYQKISAKNDKDIFIPVTETVKTDENIEYSDTFDVGSSQYKRNVIEFLSTHKGNLIYKYSEEFGVDPNLIASMAMQESLLNHSASIPGGIDYNGYGVGLLQLESPNNQEITAYNYSKKEFETEYITMENACNLDKNIKIGCMLFQNNLNNNFGNVFLAIQSHNYGQPMIDLILSENYKDIDNVKLDYENTSWLSAIVDAHKNPIKYIPNWKENTYGDYNYIKDVLRFMPIDTVTYKYDNKTYKFNLKTKQILSKDDIVYLSR